MDKWWGRNRERKGYDICTPPSIGLPVAPTPSDLVPEPK